MKTYTYKETTFLNVDLDIYSKSDLEPLVRAMGRQISIMYVGREGRSYSAHLEIAGLPRNADSAIRRFAKLINKLPQAERKLWDTARVRDFNIGIQPAFRPRSYELALAAQTIETISALGARVVVTVYAAESGK
ncbi:MAG: hypothetical protein ACRD8U_08940 [Pyrinomonadaceae bacterium]